MRDVAGELAPPPLPPPPVSAEILRISGRRNCKEAIFALENEFSDAKIAARPPHMPLGAIEVERVVTLSSSPGVVLHERGFSYGKLRFALCMAFLAHAPVPAFGQVGCQHARCCTYGRAYGKLGQKHLPVGLRGGQCAYKRQSQ